VTRVQVLLNKPSGAQVVEVMGSIILLDPKDLCCICIISGQLQISTSTHIRMNFYHLKNDLVVSIICMCRVTTNACCSCLSVTHILLPCCYFLYVNIMFHVRGHWWKLTCTAVGLALTFPSQICSFGPSY